MALIPVVALAYLKAVWILDDVKKGLILDRLENTDVSMPIKAWK